MTKQTRHTVLLPETRNSQNNKSDREQIAYGSCGIFVYISTKLSFTSGKISQELASHFNSSSRVFWGYCRCVDLVV